MSLKDREEGFFTPLGIVQIVGFIFSVMLVAIIYGLWVRPAAESYLVAEEYGVTEQLGKRSSWSVMVMDYEQQACFTLMVWVMLIVGYKYWLVNTEKRLLLQQEIASLSPNSVLVPLLPATPDNHIFAADVSCLRDQMQVFLANNQPYQKKLLPHVLLKGLQRFSVSGSIQEAVDTVKGNIDITAERLDSELSIVRYIAWAIPSIGFIGTVRGIGAALAHADQALEGDISGVTTALGLAFNSTLIALFISIFLMFFIHSLQARQEGIVLALETFCREQLIDRLRIGQRAVAVEARFPVESSATPASTAEDRMPKASDEESHGTP